MRLRALQAGLLLFACTLVRAAEPVGPTAPLPSTDATITAPLPEMTRLLTIGSDVLEVPIEELSNPLVVLQTTLGDIIVELFPKEAPRTVENFLGLATGSKPFLDPFTQLETIRPYYDGTVFHRVIDGFIIQGGSPTGLGDGFPGYRFDDEISAASLGLDKMPLVDSAGTPNPLLGIRDEADFQERILKPLYKAMAITDRDQLELRIDEVDRRVRAMTLQEHYEMLGYRYQNTLQSRAPLRGMLAMANAGPNTNGSQFFITLADAPSLTGRYTVFGKVRIGMEIAELIGRGAVDAEQRPLQPVAILAVQPL